MTRRGAFTACVVVFVASACTLVLEIAAGRLLAPYLGVSLTTREFVQKIRNLLKPEGLYLALVIDRMRGGRFMASVVRTLREVFPHVYVLADVARTMAPRAQTYVVAASPTPVDLDRLRTIRGQEPDGDGEGVVGVMPADALEDWLRVANPVVLTDDYAPADNLMAPIFLER